MRFFLTFTSIVSLLAVAPAMAADDRASCATGTGDEAINACSRLLARGQDKGKAQAVLYRNRCAAWNSKREADRAIGDCNEAIRLDAGNAAAYASRAEAWRNKSDHDQAANDYGQAIKLDGKSAPAYAGRCLALANKRDNDRALSDCNEAIRLDAKYAPAYAARCHAWFNKKDGNRALDDCDQAIHIDPNHYLGYNMRGVVRAEKRDYDRAIADYDQAIRIDPAYKAAYINRAIAWRAKREPDRAISDTDQVIRIDPKAANAYNLRALARADKRDFDGAITDYGEAIRLDPKYATAYQNRGHAWASKRDYDRAITDHDEALKINPKYALALNNRGWALRSKSDHDRAIADFTEAIRLEPKYAFAYANRGITHMDKRDYDRALSDFNEAIKADSTFTAAYTNRALAYERKGDRARARTEFEAALAIPQKYNNGKWAHDTARERLAALTSTPVADASRSAVDPPARRSGADLRAGADLPVQRSAATPGTSQTRQVPPVQGRVQRIALVIGNANYPDADPPLTQSANDARLFAGELKAAGFEVELAENLTKQQLQEATERFKTKIKPGTAAVLYFGGIAIQSGRRNYMIPVNAQIWSERDVPRDGISFESVLGDIADGGMAVKLLIVDGSRRNPFERRFRNAAAGLAPIVAPTNTLVMSATGLGQVVDDGSGKNSLFMTELLKEFRAAEVTLEEVFSRARIGVSRASDSEQVPWVSSTLMESISFKPADERRRTR
jgi:tetratricopeptide (TPR) repeat protein